MNRISTGILASTLFLVSACGNSSSGNSKGNAECKTADNIAKLNSIVVPGSNTNSPANKNPAIPGNPANAGDEFPTPQQTTAALQFQATSATIQQPEHQLPAPQQLRPRFLDVTPPMSQSRTRQPWVETHQLVATHQPVAIVELRST